MQKILIHYFIHSVEVLIAINIGLFLCTCMYVLVQIGVWIDLVFGGVCFYYSLVFAHKILKIYMISATYIYYLFWYIPCWTPVVIFWRRLWFLIILKVLCLFFCCLWCVNIQDFTVLEIFWYFLLFNCILHFIFYFIL